MRRGGHPAGCREYQPYGSLLNNVRMVGKMIKLLVIADDLTGALDTGVKFSSSGSVVFLRADRKESFRDLLETAMRPAARVAVIDARTRHLPPEEAYRIVSKIVKAAKEMKIPFLYKKTDSGLRGSFHACISGRGVPQSEKGTGPGMYPAGGSGLPGAWD